MSYPQPPNALNVEVERQSFTEHELGVLSVNHLHSILLHTRTHLEALQEQLRH